ncbi:hypothetical protein [Microbacterium sp. SS28]|uniref:hypothetical protein n=1 Tax=Microbacterium sp. SS28 TaxID=2919948 RepID=UPI001FA9E835|nr:hypothetical protein [Microbacterium sp. SS28]
MNRTLNVIRMQFVNRQTFVWVPLIVLGGSLLLSLLIYAMIPGDFPKYGGGAWAPLWYLLAVGIQSLTMTFPFSQAMSVTRREFYLGTLLTAGIAAAVLAIVFVVGGLIEQATDGWGMNGWFFYLPWIWAAGPLGAAFFYFVTAVLLFIVGFWAATLYKRFGATVLTSVLVGIGLLFVGLLWLIGRLDAWEQIGVWLATSGSLGLAAGMAVAAVVLAGIAYLTLRRTVP